MHPALILLLLPLAEAWFILPWDPFDDGVRTFLGQIQNVQSYFNAYQHPLTDGFGLGPSFRLSDCPRQRHPFQGGGGPSHYSPSLCHSDWECPYASKCCGGTCTADYYNGPLTLGILDHSLHEAFRPRRSPIRMKMTRSMAAKRNLAFHPPSFAVRSLGHMSNGILKSSLHLHIKDPLDSFHSGDLSSLLGDRLSKGHLQLGQVDDLLFKVAAEEPDCEVMQHLNCDPHDLYRTLDGTCNNLQKPYFGAINEPFRRYLPNAYADGINAPRLYGVDGKPLPSPRAVSIMVHDRTEINDRKGSHMIMQFGQFLDHDLTLTPEMMPEEKGMDETVDCAECESYRYFEGCSPIPIPYFDPHFEPGTCMDFKRSVAGQLHYGPREQINSITAYIDASNVYGHTQERAAMLREKGTGRLLLGPDRLMPRRHEDPCPAIHPDACLMAGDVRVNVQLGLTSIHQLFVDHHNTILEGLSHINPYWGPGKLYSETRKIIGAMNQVITYKEWLPIIVGPNLMRKFGLDFRGGQRYNPHCSATLANVFAAAAMRFGHTTIKAVFDMNSGDKYDLFHGYFIPRNFSSHNMMNNLLHGMCHQHCNAFDVNMQTNIQEHLFEAPNDHHAGLDLIALNLHRARDHGLPGWVHYRKFFHLSVPRSFDDVLRLGIASFEAVHRLRHVYRHVEDVDVFTGMMAEIPQNGAMVGPTTAAVLIDNFRRVKYCDRFWLQWAPGWNQRQIHAVLQTTMSKIMCDEVSQESFLPLHAFWVPPTHDTRRLHCFPEQDKIVSIDLSAWREASHYGPRFVAHPHLGGPRHPAFLHRKKRDIKCRPHSSPYNPRSYFTHTRIPLRCYPKQNPELVCHFDW